MKKHLLVVVVALLSMQTAFSQKWSAMKNAPVVAQRFDDIYFVNDTLGFAVDGFGSIYKSGAKDKAWVSKKTTRHYNRSIEFLDASTGFVGSVDSAVYRTTDGGETWNAINSKFPMRIPGICGMSHRGDTILMVGTYYAPPFVLRSYDRGDTWQYIDMSEQASGLVDTWFKSADTVFVSGIDNNGHGIILRSADTGSTWTDVSASAAIPAGFLWKLQFITPSIGYGSVEEVDFDDSDLSNTTTIVKTTDGGRSWTSVDTHIGKNIDLQGIGFVDKDHGWIGGWSTGMYETLDGGQTWKLFNQFANLNRFFYIRKNLAYFSGTTIFRYADVVTGIQEPTESHDVHALEIYPNPAQQNTVAKLTLGTHTMVVLAIHDLSGRTIKEIYRGYAEAGEHEYPVDLREMAPGVYAVILLTHEHFLGRKLVKAKN